MLLLLFGAPAKAQQTQLILYAKWDDGTPVQATVSLHQAAIAPSDKILAVTNTCCSSGWASITYDFSQTGTYFWNITCSAPAGSKQLAACPNGTLLASYPLLFVFVDPAHIPRGEADLVFRKADRTLKTAKLIVNWQ